MREAVRKLPLETKAPDMIFDLGAVGKEPMVRVFDNTAVEVVGKVKRIVERVMR